MTNFMSKNYIFLLIFIFVIFSLFLSSEKVFATVGGQTYISQIAYNASDDSVYYIENNYGGKGCPPIIHSVNLSKIQDVDVKTCDEVLQEFFSNYSARSGENEGRYNEFIAGIYQNLLNLGGVSLKKNNIDIRVEFLSERIEAGEKFWTEFRATITQDSKEIAKLDFRGCVKDQPHIFEGYRIPNTDAMAILISNKGDCFEGGYVQEILKVVRGITYYDTNTVRSIKENTATEPNLGNIVVYANSAEAIPKKSAREITLLVATLLVGAMLGYVIGRKTLQSVKK